MTAVTPLDIVKRTPKSNCGECGFASCLAFGAAVATQGADAGRCPYLDRHGLDLQPAAGPGSAHERDLELVAYLKSKVAQLDFNHLAGVLGMDLPDADTLRGDYLGQPVLIGKDGIRINDREPDDPRDQILLYNYVSLGGGPPLAGEWIGMESMPNSISKVKTLETYCEKRLADLFDRQTPQKLDHAGNQAGGGQTRETGTDFGCTVTALPMVPMKILFWRSEPEDGFEARVKILFDKNALGFLDIESLLFCAERLAERFEELLKQDDTGQ